MASFLADDDGERQDSQATRADPSVPEYMAYLSRVVKKNENLTAGGEDGVRRSEERGGVVVTDNK